MRLENITVDAVNPVRVAEFWEAALGAERQLTSLELIETRLTIPDGPWLDICVQQVPTPPAEDVRLHFDLLGGDAQEEIADRLLSLGANLYIVVEYRHLTSNLVQIMGFREVDYIVAALGILLVLEATRRCVGLPIVIIASLAIAYSIFVYGMSWQNYAVGTFFTARSGVFGTPIQVSSTFIFLFLLFAVVLIRTNIGAFFNDLAFRVAGRFTGGPAKAAVAASGLQGMISGSSVANTVA